MNKKESLESRYNENFISEAEKRRTALKYNRIHVGLVTNDRIEHLLKLLFQAHQNYYFGYFEASCTLAGCMLEQALIILLEEKIKEEGFVSVKKKTDKGIIYNKIKTSEELSQCNIGVLISIVSHYDMLPEEEYFLAKNLQIIRNAIVHNMLPEFEIAGKFYESRLTERNVIMLDINEIIEHTLSRQSIEMWAYYILTRTRSLIEFLFRERAKKFPPEDLIKK